MQETNEKMDKITIWGYNFLDDMFREKKDRTGAEHGFFGDESE